jgi:hypothetical protein
VHQPAKHSLKGLAPDPASAIIVSDEQLNHIEPREALLDSAFGSDLCCRPLGRRAQPQLKSHVHLRRRHAASLLNDASDRVGDVPGLTDFLLCLRRRERSRCA